MFLVGYNYQWFFLSTEINIRLTDIKKRCRWNGAGPMIESPPAVGWSSFSHSGGHWGAFFPMLLVRSSSAILLIGKDHIRKAHDLTWGRHLIKSWDQNRFRVFVIGWQSVLENHVFFHLDIRLSCEFSANQFEVFRWSCLAHQAESQLPTKSDRMISCHPHIDLGCHFISFSMCFWHQEVDLEMLIWPQIWRLKEFANHVVWDLL